MSREKRIDSASRVIDAPEDAVYGAFSDPAAWEQWLPPSGMTGRIEWFDVHERGHYRLTLAYPDGSGTSKTTPDEDVSERTFVGLVPNERVVQEIAFAGTMLMTWSLEARTPGTQVTITAENVPLGISPGNHAAGLQSTLENLARCVESAGRSW